MILNFSESLARLFVARGQVLTDLSTSKPPAVCVVFTARVMDFFYQRDARRARRDDASIADQDQDHGEDAGLSLAQQFLNMLSTMVICFLVVVCE